MNRKAFIKIALFSIAIALILSLCSLLFLNRLTAIQASRFRDDFLAFFVPSLEKRLQNLSLQEIRTLNGRIFRHGPPSFGPPPEGLRPPGPPPMMPPPPRPLGGGAGFGPGMWLLTAQGEVIAQRDNEPWTLSWKDLPHPQVSGKAQSREDFFRLKPSISVVKLATPEPLYLVVVEDKRLFLAPLLMTQAVLTASMIVIALVVAMASIFFYLRRKSEEARSVLRRLEQGDLKARFEIKRFDEFGELMLDFNRMAEEIETLVRRIHETETKRKELLQELGHDLRTPLTSLKTNFETLQVHHEKLSVQQKTSMFGILIGEIDYFKDLIEKLMTIASLDEPHYKKSTVHVDIQELLLQEIKARQNAPDNKLTWIFDDSLSVPDRVVLGDAHLIQRLLRNGLDNASRYAETKVFVQLRYEEGKIQVRILDDGPGLDNEALHTFGLRREFQGRRLTKGGHYSLGLGSVIMKTIAELHNGKIQITNHVHDGKKEGAVLSIELPVAP